MVSLRDQGHCQAQEAKVCRLQEQVHAGILAKMIVTWSKSHRSHIKTGCCVGAGSQDRWTRIESEAKDPKQIVKDQPEKR